MPKRECPFCGAPTPAAAAGSGVCEYCRTPIYPEQGASGGPGADFPYFSNHPIACPNCEKKALRPRIRTGDFRCQRCTAIFPGDEIERRCRLYAQRDGAVVLVQNVLLSIVRRAIPREFAGPPKESEDPSSALTCLALLAVTGAGVGAGYVCYGQLATWTFGWRLLASVGAGLVGAVALGLLLAVMASRASDKKLEADPQWRWERENPDLVALRGAFSGFLAVEMLEHLNEELAGGVSPQRVERLKAEANLAKARMDAALAQVSCALSGIESRQPIDDAVARFGNEKEQAQYAYALAAFRRRDWERRGTE